MPKRKLKSADWPRDSFLEYEIATDGSVTLEIASRYEGERNFQRLRIRLSPEDASNLSDRMRTDIGWTKLQQ